MPWIFQNLILRIIQHKANLCKIMIRDRDLKWSCLLIREMVSWYSFSVPTHSRTIFEYRSTAAKQIEYYDKVQDVWHDQLYFEFFHPEIFILNRYHTVYCSFTVCGFLLRTGSQVSGRIVYNLRRILRCSNKKNTYCIYPHHFFHFLMDDSN